MIHFFSFLQRTSAVFGTTSARNSISMRPLGEPPIVISKNTTGFSPIPDAVAALDGLLALPPASSPLLPPQPMVNGDNDWQGSWRDFRKIRMVSFSAPTCCILDPGCVCASPFLTSSTPAATLSLFCPHKTVGAELVHASSS